MAVQIREFGPRDAAFLATLARDPRVVRYVGDGSVWSDDYIAERTAQALAPSPWGERGGAHWVTLWTSAEDDGAVTAGEQRIGLALAMFKTLDGVGDCTEIGYWLAPDFWGQGLAKPMVRAVVSWVLATTSSDREVPVVARIAPDNAASAATVRGLGFERIGMSEGMDVFTLAR
ncbi:GNAT family N-acetyltransferase [Zhihengliuella flava]|uniref:RimJ/RimL family protein N-acetyltransferase n=1 Tax=Zhihengliuella flava TaxID=1285193 RepID=A0A931DAB6_9MICC|nr:GNAT family N-acetyltransferase [Zhihengliuella flava]MBG6084913.1 RimJ/RimL family protein N-acetyltransferase [Zhihengliuella flava]